MRFPLIGVLALLPMLGTMGAARSEESGQDAQAGDAISARMKAYRAIDPIYDVDFYGPRAPLKAASSAAPLLRQSVAPTDEAALRQALSYAQKTQTKALIVARGETVIFERYWDGTGPDTLSQSQSMAKPVIALLAGLMEDAGMLAPLDTPVATFLPVWANDPRGLTTLRQLLTMSSGLANTPLGKPPGPNNRSTLLALGPNSLAAAMNTTRVAPPGARFNYSNSDTQILTGALRAAAGAPLNGVLTETLWQKLALHDGWLTYDKPAGLVRGFCCMVASAEDWTRLGILIAQHGHFEDQQLISAQAIQAMRTP